MQIHGKDVVSLRQPAADGLGPEPLWFNFVSVVDIESSAERAVRFGGQVLREVVGHPEVGRMAVVRDPLGALIGLWQPGSHIGARIGLEVNTVCWTELASNDPVVSAGFYSGLFGWTIKEDAEYIEYLLSGVSQAGMRLAARGESRWSVYFRVSDCDTTTVLASQLGGSVLLPPTAIPGVGRFSRLRDPSGADFSVVRLEEE
jgi:predicted enzyme related to lactoylglutathione lyase